MLQHRMGQAGMRWTSRLGHWASRGARWSNSPWVALLLTLVLYGAFARGYLRAQGGDITAFILLGVRTNLARLLTPGVGVGWMLLALDVLKR